MSERRPCGSNSFFFSLRVTGRGPADTCTLASATVIETAPAYLTEADCHRQLGGIPREAKIENDPRTGYATVICASREDIRREAQKSETDLLGT